MTKQYLDDFFLRAKEENKKAHEQVVLDVRTAIENLPKAQRDQCLMLINHIQLQIKIAGEPVGTLALALVGAEAQLELSK